MAAPVLPVYAKSFDVSFAVATLVIIVHGFGSVAATVPAGYLIDRIGRRPVLLAGPILTAVASFLTATAGSFPELLVYRFIGGFAMQMWQQSRLAMIADTGGDRERGRMITWMMGMQRSGQLISPAIGGFVAAAFDIRIPFILHGILCLVAIVPSFWLAVETSPTAGSRARGGRGAAQGDWGDVLRAIRTRQMMAFLAAQFLANIARGVSRGGILNLYAVYAYDVGPATLGVLNTANSVVGLPIGFTSGYLMDRFGRKTTIVPGFSLIAASSIFMAFTAFAQVSFPVFVVAFICLHASQSLTGGNMQVLGSDLAPANARGRFFALWRLVSEGGGSLSPVIFAGMAEAFGYAPAFGLLGVSAMTVALIIGLLVRETIGRYRIDPVADRPEPAPSSPAGSTRA